MDEKNRQLQAMLDSKEELVGAITHDLKGLISGVEGGIYFVSSGIKKHKKARVDQGIEMMQRSLARIRRTVAGSLYYVKDRNVDLRLVDIQQLIVSVCSDLEQQAHHLGVSLKANDGAGTIQADQLAVHSLFSNLAEYAMEACSIAKLHSSPTVTLSATINGDLAVFEVLGNGFVIPEITREQALGQYFAPSGLDRSHLGTFMAHRLVQSHGGKLHVVSSEDEGTTCFVVEMPVTGPADVQTEAGSATMDRLAREWEDDLK
jgi:signal transduction histidine kinase